MKKLLINGKEVKGIGFVYDGCHKIFVVENDDLQDVYEKWGENETIYPLEEIEQKYNESKQKFIESIYNPPGGK